MKNHFVMSYFGNKREEVEIIYKNLLDNFNLDDIETIIEPYCGSSALSYYISTMHPKKFKYILNDNNTELIELYKILLDKDKLKKFVDDVNNKCFINDNFIDKETYKNIVKGKDILSWFIKNKFYDINYGMYPLNKKNKKLQIELLEKCPIVNFLRTENITFSNIDALELIKKNNNDKTLILCDPPYLNTCNEYYQNKDINIYEWLYNNKYILKNCIFILENMWIIKLLFKGDNVITYEKKYNNAKKKVVDHAIIILNSTIKTCLQTMTN